jgi:hypothetical protein
MASFFRIINNKCKRRPVRLQSYSRETKVINSLTLLMCESGNLILKKNCRHYAMCKIDFLGSGVCASGLEKHFVSYYPQGRMILYEALAENKITVTAKMR